MWPSRMGSNQRDTVLRDDCWELAVRTVGKYLARWGFTATPFRVLPGLGETS